MSNIKGEDLSKVAANELLKVMLAQDKFGMKKYGVPLDPLDPKYDWLKMELEERADGTKYIFCDMLKRDHVVRESIPLIRLLMETQDYDERQQIGWKTISTINMLKGEGEGVGDHKSKGGDDMAKR